MFAVNQQKWFLEAAETDEDAFDIFSFSLLFCWDGVEKKIEL